MSCMADRTVEQEGILGVGYFQGLTKLSEGHTMTVHWRADLVSCMCSWRRNQFAAGVQPALPKLLWMDVSDNMLSGKLPDFGDLNRPPYFISNGGLLNPTHFSLPFYHFIFSSGKT